MYTLLEKINQVGLKFLPPLNRNQTYELIVKEAVKLVGAQSAVLYMFEGGELVNKTSYPVNLPKLIIRPQKHGFTYKAFDKKEALVIHEKEFYKIHPKNYPRVNEKRFGTAIFIPIASQNKGIGVLSLISPEEKSFLNKDLKILKVFGSYVNLTINKADAFEEIKDALSSRDLFISMMSHEMRTPITTIYGYAQLLYDKIPKNSSTTTRWVRDLYTEVVRLNILVNDLLEINRIKTGKTRYNFTECNLKDLINRTTRNFELNYPNRKIIFIDKLNKKEAKVIGDADKLLQVLINLLENAIKFSPQDTPIEITLKKDISNLVMVINDYGQGIAKKDIPKIFEGFYQANKNSPEGLGLGLFLVKNIIDQHHGEIEIHSTLNQGTSVEVKLPVIKS